MDAAGLLKGITSVASTVPAAGPALVAMLEVATQVCELMEGVKTNCEEYAKLAEEVAQYASAVSETVQSDLQPTAGSRTTSNQRQESVRSRVEKLTTVFSEVEEAIKSRQAQDAKLQNNLVDRAKRRLHRIRHSNDDKDKINKLREKIDNSVKVFQISTNIRGLGSLERIEGNMKTFEARHSDDQLHEEQDLLERKLAPVFAARFDAVGAPEGCLPQTRVRLLDQIKVWASDDSPSSADVFCLTGLAGTGKTSIAQSVSAYYDRHRPAANFLISRSAAERRSPERIVQTLVYQLGQQDGGLRTAIYAALRNGRDVTTRPLAEQVQDLFTAPLSSLRPSTSSALIVIDALDECDKIAGREGGDLIPLIVAGVRQLSGRVKVLVTSREEPAIMAMLKVLGLHSSPNYIQLQNIEDVVVEEDIRSYYVYHFRRIAVSAGIEDPDSWPSKATVDLLVKQTGKLFVYAALLIRIVGGNSRVDPREQLEEILGPSFTSTGTSQFHALDERYLAVLDKATTSGDDSTDNKITERVRHVIAALVLLQTPLNTSTLAKLLGKKESLIRGDIDHLSAVLIIPDNTNNAVTIFHPSFSDYVTMRCIDPRFRVDPAVYHAYLARRCLSLMSQHLKRNILTIRDPFTANVDIENIHQRRDMALPLELRYACEYWTAHVSQARKSDQDLIDGLNDFCIHHLFHWLETLSLLEKLSAASTGLANVIRWCKQQPPSKISTALSLLEDTDRVVQVYDTPIRAAALQVYHSALVFMPICGLYERVKHEGSEVIELKSNRLNNWPALRRILEGHTESVTTIACSPDGTRIASGSDDMTVRVWDVITGGLLTQLKDHTGGVTSVAFSPDGTRIVSSCWEKAMRTWDASTGSMLVEFEGHIGHVNSVAFSPDGRYVASGSDDKTVWLWDAETASPLAMFEGHSDSVKSVAFSPTGIRLASGSEDKTARIWDASTGSCLARFKGHTTPVVSVAFSPDGTRIASGSLDEIICVWDANTACLVFRIQGHETFVTSLAFSPDSTRIASGSYDETVRIWDAATGTLLSKLEGHIYFVTCVAFSPDGTRIISSSYDKTVRVWDAEAPKSLSKVEGHTGSLTSVAFSFDKSHMVSGSEDMTVGVWSMNTGRKLAQLEGHTDSVTCVAFSPDGVRIASGSDDKTVRVWNMTTSSLHAQLVGHSRSVASVAYSPDGTRIASGSADKTLCVWDANTGLLLAQLEGHTHTVHYVAFSEDGAQIVSKDYNNNNNQRIWQARSDFPTTDSNEHIMPHVPLTESLSPVFDLDYDSGWLTAKRSAENNPRRLCWVPPERRGDIYAAGDDVAIGTDSGGVTILSIRHQQ